MSSTILMAIVLVVMWLVVLVPMFVRRGDDRAETRSMDRFATAMRVLSRRAPGSGGVAGRRPYATSPPATYADGASPVRAAARARMMGRRRTLAVLSVTTLLGLPAVMLVTSWLWLVQLPAVLLLTGYVGWLRQQVRREQERRGRRAALFGGSTRMAGGRLEHPAGRRLRSPGSRPAAEDTGSATAVGQGNRSWRPVPVPTPTYVTAPVVRRRPDTLVDLDDDDLSFADLEPPGDTVDRPRAVNE